MRIFMTIAAGTALAFGPIVAAHAQSATTPPVETPGEAPGQAAPVPSAPATPPAAAPEAPAAAAPAITSVTVVDVQELPADTQKQVNDVVAQRGDADLQNLRSSIEAMPELKSALEAKGATTNDVIAASMGEGGALTLITKKAS
jgi:hypothetical protein